MTNYSHTSESSPDIAGMGEAGLRFAEQFEIKRVLAAFERELVEVVDGTKIMEAERADVYPGG